MVEYLSLTFILAVIMWAGIVNRAEASQGVINYDVVNIRSGPGTNYQIAGTILKDSKVTILKTQGDWRQVNFGNINGWIAGQYIDAVGIGDIMITGEMANLRSGPGTTYTAIGKANKGESFTLLSSDGEWYHILTSSGLEAYVAGYLAKVSSAVPISSNNTGSTVKTSSTGTASTSSSKPITVILNGKTMSFEVPPMIENGRTLVPLRAIFEAMGATVEWNESTKTAIARKGSDTVVVPLNSIKPTVNGKFYTLETPAKIVQNRTLAPLRFVAEAFGGEVDWNDSSKTIKITASGNGDTDRPSAVTARAQDVYVREQPSGSASALCTVHPGEKLTVIGEKNEWYQVSRGSTTGWVASWLVEASTGNDSSTTTDGTNPGGQSTNTPSATDTANTVHVLKTSDNKGIKITISSTESFKPEIKQTSGVIQYDLGEAPLAVFNNVDETLGDGRLTIRGTTVEERNIVTIGLPSWVKYQLDSQNNRIYTITIPNCITSIEKTPFGSVGDRFIVHSLCPITGQTGNLDGSQLVVKIPDVSLKTGYRFSASGTLFSSVDFDEDDEDVIITIDTSGLGRYSFATTGSKKELNIVLMRKMETHTGEKIVVLDPGHGGSDPGSLGSTLKEKDVALAVALKTGAILQQRGIKVEYTRTDDTFMELSEEAGIGNAVDATVFVAFHCNSCDTPGPGGTETYFYAPLDTPELYAEREERSRLANLLQSKMIANLHLADRGVKDNQAYYVLNHTNMPSALVEMAFINNPNEEQLLARDDIRDLAAQAIADAIQEYLQSI